MGKFKKEGKDGEERISGNVRGETRKWKKDKER